jgi:hypothetical protein
VRGDVQAQAFGTVFVKLCACGVMWLVLIHLGQQVSAQCGCQVVCALEQLLVGPPLAVGEGRGGALPSMQALACMLLACLRQSKRNVCFATLLSHLIMSACPPARCGPGVQLTLFELCDTRAHGPLTQT